jgi:hypothetical protein
VANVSAENVNILAAHGGFFFSSMLLISDWSRFFQFRLSAARIRFGVKAGLVDGWARARRPFSKPHVAG